MPSNSLAAARRHRHLWEIGLILVTALWGWSFVAIHEALAHLSDSAFNAWRFLVAALALVFSVVRNPSKLSRRDIVQGTMAGAALYLAFLFQTKGLKYTSASNAAFITGLAVVFTPVFSLWWLDIRPKPQQIAGIVVATVGLAMLTLKGLGVQLGDLLVLLCAASFAAHITVLSKASKQADVLNLAFVQILVVGLLSLGQSVLLGEMSVPTEPQAIRAILLIGVLGTAVGFFVQTRAQVASPPSLIALIIVLEPVFGGFFGYVLAGDRLSPVNWAGAGLILGGMLVSELRFGEHAPNGGGA